MGFTVIGETPVLDDSGYVPIVQLPPDVIPEFFDVADATERLALTVQMGDECKQADDGSWWIYDGSAWRLRPGSGTTLEHDMGGGSHIADTLANLNSKITDAELDDKNSVRPIGVDAKAAVQLLTGDVTYKNNVNDEVDKADASSWDTAKVIGVAIQTINTGEYGPIRTYGKYPVKFVGGLTLNPGDSVYLSETAGMCSNEPPAGVDSASVYMGYVWNTSTYAGDPGDTALVWLDADLAIEFSNN